MKPIIPFFKRNTIELPKGYRKPRKRKQKAVAEPAQPLQPVVVKPKPRLRYRRNGRMMPFRRRNEPIPRGMNWCEINGQKLRQDVFFGDVIGRKWIPGRLTYFDHSNLPMGDGCVITNRYGDGGCAADGAADGSTGGSTGDGCMCEGCACGTGDGSTGSSASGGEGGCACEGCVGGAGEGCTCTGDAGSCSTGGGGGFGCEGCTGGPGEGCTCTGDAGACSTGGGGGFGCEGCTGGPGEGCTCTGDAGACGGGTTGDGCVCEGCACGPGDGSGPGGPSFSDMGPSFADPTGSTLSNQDFFGPSFADTRGMDMEFNPFAEPLSPLNVNPDIASRGVFDPNFNESIIDPSGRSVTVDPNYVGSQGLGPQDGQYGSAFGPGGRGPASPFAALELEANPLTTVAPIIGPQNINEGPFNVPGLPITGLDPQGRTAPVDPGFDPATINAFPSLTDPNAPAAPVDAKGVFGGLNPATLMETLGALIGPNQAQAQTISTPWGRVSSDEIAAAAQAPTTSQLGLDLSHATANQMGAQVGGVQPGLAEALGARGLATDPESQGSRGPISTAPEETGRTMSEPHTVMTDPGRTMAEEHTQPTIAEFWEGSPSISRGAEENPFAPNPVGPANLNTSQSLPAWATTFGDPTVGLNAPTNWGNPNAPTAEQMAAARDAMVQLAMQQEAQNPLTDVFGRSVTDPATFERTDPGRTMTEPHNQPSLDDLLTHMLDIQSKGEQGRDPSVPAYTLPAMSKEAQQQQEQEARAEEELEQQERTAVERMSVPTIPMPTPNPLTAAERAQVDRAPTQITVNPSRSEAPGRSGLSAPGRGAQTGSLGRGAQTGSLGRGAQTGSLGRGAQAGSLGRGSDRGTGRDSPGVQGLPAGLRGNEVAQALVSRGFDPNMVGAALTISDRGAMLTAMLESMGLSHAQAVATASAARGQVAAQHGIPSGNVNSSGVARAR